MINKQVGLLVLYTALAIMIIASIVMTDLRRNEYLQHTIDKQQFITKTQQCLDQGTDQSNVTLSKVDQCVDDVANALYCQRNPDRTSCN